MQPREFEFNGVKYGYFVHPINSTGSNERCVEVPVSVPHRCENMIEFGNVLTQYGFGGHPVLDMKDGTIKENILTWQPEQEYDCCISISTLEHVGEGRHCQEENLRAALKKLRGCCKKLFATIPMGYSFMVDDVCRELFDQKWFMRRVGPMSWVQCDDFKGSYGSPFQSGNALLIGGWGCE